jgi:MoaA/NifB/PqqE/SkfB family radical SAM enzyme
MAGVNMFHVSFHSYKKQTQDNMVWLEWSYEKTLRWLYLLVQKNCYVWVQIVITKENLHDLKDTVEFLLGRWIIHFTLRFPTIDGSMRQHIDTILPSYSDVQWPLREVAHLFSWLKWRYLYLMNVPPCIIPEARQYIVTWIRNYLIELDGKNSHYFEAKKRKNQFSEVCDSCIVKESCMGIEPEYSDKYGFWECAPIWSSSWINTFPIGQNALQLYKDWLTQIGKKIGSPEALQSYILTPEFYQAQEIPITMLQSDISAWEAVAVDSMSIDYRVNK